MVRKVGNKVSWFKEGDEVFGCTGTNFGGHATIVNIPADLLVEKPDFISHVEAASLPVAYLTADYSLKLAELKEGEKILIQTAASSTGLIAIQLAKQKNAKIYATTGSQEKIDFLHQLGIKDVINYHTQDFEALIKKETNGEGVDIVLNMLSGDAVQKGINLLASGGRYIELAVGALRSLTHLDLSQLTNNQRFYSVDLRKSTMNASKSLVRDSLSI